MCVCVLAAPSVPRNVSAAAVNATTLKVTWTLPASYVETINEYRVCLTHATSSGRDSVQCYTKTELYQKQILTYNEVRCALRCGRIDTNMAVCSVSRARACYGIVRHLVVSCF